MCRYNTCPGVFSGKVRHVDSNFTWEHACIGVISTHTTVVCVGITPIHMCSQVKLEMYV